MVPGFDSKKTRPGADLTLLLLKVIKVNVLPSISTHKYEVHKGEHGILYFAQTIADVAISSHNITHTFHI